MQLLKNIRSIFYPELCVGCDDVFVEDEQILCVNCRHNLPLITIEDYQNNEIKTIFEGRIQFKNGSSFLLFTKRGITRRIIHELKYRGNERIGTFLGNWYGKILKHSAQFDTIDYVVPVPLHPKRLKERGYNQLTQFGQRLSEHLNCAFVPGILIRVNYLNTQTKKGVLERFELLNDNFKLTNINFFERKHVLLVDDVITTGGTIQACAQELMKTQNITLSFVTMAFAERN